MLDGASVRLGDWTFSPDFVTAGLETGATCRFTPSECLVLKRLVASAGQVVSREMLVDALYGCGSNASDRIVDFIISRLRSKLRDCARQPRYIASRYAQGYVWVAPPLAGY
jgi:DNA-binding response OmpR family regulator